MAVTEQVVSYPSPTTRVEPGHLVHIDLGVRLDGYCSDLQRMWYVRRPGETARHGHFGRELPMFGWEKTDKVDALRKAAGV